MASQNQGYLIYSRISVNYGSAQLLYMVYQTAQFSMNFNDPTPGFKVTPFFDAEYLRNGTRYIASVD